MANNVRRHYDISDFSPGEEPRKLSNIAGKKLKAKKIKLEGKLLLQIETKLNYLTYNYKNYNLLKYFIRDLFTIAL